MSALIPAPARREPMPGACPVARHWQIRTTEPALDATADVLRDLLAPHLAAVSAAGGSPGTAPGTIELTLGDVAAPPAPLGVCPLDGEPVAADPADGTAPAGGPSDEAYRLTVTPDALTCRARTPRGVFRAAVSALHLLATAPLDGVLECGHIDDAPRYAWRGLMLDPARSFIALDDVLRLIDVAALYKLNVVHLHLTDHQGWRLEIPGLPALTADPGHPSYTAREYRDLQDYAAARHITVVPEIGVPGHCGAALRACPGLGTLPRPAALGAGFPYIPPLDAYDPASRAFITDVLTETARLTDGPFVHFGGDEALGASGDDFDEAIRLARSVLREAGKRPLGWQEAARAGMGPGDIGQFWVDPEMQDLPRNEEELNERPELLAAGFTPALVAAMRRFFAPTADDLGRIVTGGGRVLLSPQSHLYLDRPYASGVIPAEQAGRAARLGFTYRPRGVRYGAAWDPAALGLEPEHIAGVEATLFGESLRGLDDLTLMLLPRLAGVAEAAWTGVAPEWDTYRERLARQAGWWRERGLSALLSTEIDWR
ncbi:family 20 glycosylhydrolase [Streptomyces sp. DW26H14]|uniref:family 20 glycosylhydrolase n=1 Tax=Streptomyces sp. DW26H14 TaxID=3435395 RepID=UPI00403DCE24